MYRFITLSLFILSWFTGIAQIEFCPTGATWVYYLGPNGGLFYPETEEVTTVVGDSLVSGLVSKHLVTTRTTTDHYNGGIQNQQTLHQFVVVQGDSILSFENEVWELIFRAGPVGDTADIYVGTLNAQMCDTHLLAVVESVTDTIIYGTTLSRYNYRFVGETNVISNYGHFVDRIGFTFDTPIEHPIYCPYPGSHWQPYFCSYSDSSITVVPVSECDSVLSVLDPIESEQAIRLLGDFLQIQSAQISSLIVYNILGERLMSSPVSSNLENINITALPNGVLLVVLENEVQRFTKKIVKTTY